MPVSNLWKAGTVINGYTMLEDAYAGERAFSGKAKSPAGKIVFFKQYITPSATLTPWYKEYVAYQKEIKNRIAAIYKTDSYGRNQGPTYRLLEFFEDIQKKMDPKTLKKEDIPVYCQVFESLDNAKNLETFLNSAETTWEERKKIASLLMFVINELHTKCGIIHCDLKPWNIFIVSTTTEEGGVVYQIKITDLDFSILKDIKAPWDGIDGYAGTYGYYSPEHLRDEVPTEKSDIFTCGLTLYEILAKGGHPYAGENNEGIRTYKSYEEYPAPLPELRGSFGSPEKDAEVAQMLQRMLDLDPDKRPTALDVHNVLIKS